MKHTLKQLFEKNELNKIVLPDFQRDLEWKEEKQKSLLSSFLVRLPIGSLLLLEGSKDDFPARSIGINNKQITPKDECYYLLDGQQRLTSLKVFFDDFFKERSKWKKVWELLYRQLRTRWFIRINNNEGEQDFFGYNNLIFNESIISKAEPSDITDFIETEKILKTKNLDWFHPGYVPKNENNNKLTNSRFLLDIARKCAEKKLIPLYAVTELDKSTNSLIDKVLNEIAKTRVDDIKADLENMDNVSKDQKFKILFPDNDDFGNIDPQEQEQCWTHLSVKWQTAIKSYLKGLLDQEIQIINLPKDEIARGIAIFTSINEGGQKLSTYDLIVAKAAKSMKESLSAYIKGFFEKNDILKNNIEYQELSWNGNKFGAILDNKLSDYLKNHYLNIISILTHTEHGNFSQDTTKKLKLEHLKASMHLALTYTDIEKNTKPAIRAILRAYAFFQLRCGVQNLDSLAYQLMLIPVAYVFHNDKHWKSKKTWDKIEYWYWTSLFSGYYREAQNERSIKDTIELFKWIDDKNKNNPFESRLENIFKDTRYSDLETLLLKDDEGGVPKAIHKGLLQFVLSCKPKDFVKINNKNTTLKAWEFTPRLVITVKDENKKNSELSLCLEDHHIFPLAQATKIGESSKELRKDTNHILNSPLNRTYITNFSNSEIKARDAKSYLKEISEYSKSNHFIPDVLVDKYASKNDNDVLNYYEKLLTDRFNNIKNALINRLTHFDF